MRISTSQMYQSHLGRIQESQTQMFALQRQVMTGKRFERMSEDPVAGQRVLSAQGLQRRLEQTDRNLRHADEYLGLTETTLGQISDLTQEAKTLAIQGASAAAQPESLQALATQIGEIQKRLVDLGNTRTTTGGYLMSGQDTGTRAFTVSGTGITYDGDDLPVNVEIRPGETMRVNLPQAGPLVIDLYNRLENLKSNLLAGRTQDISGTDLVELEDSRSQVNAARGSIGTLMQTVANQKEQTQRRIDDLTTRISEVQDVDLAEAMTNLQLAQTAYQAALTVTARASQLSLMDYL
jgi:flagellar hook-associated protein 3 FlgL